MLELWAYSLYETCRRINTVDYQPLKKYSSQTLNIIAAEITRFILYTVNYS